MSCVAAFLFKSLLHFCLVSSSRGCVCMLMQLDNQLPGAVFPIVISPVLPPKSVAADSG